MKPNTNPIDSHPETFEMKGKAEPTQMFDAPASKRSQQRQRTPVYKMVLFVDRSRVPQKRKNHTSELVKYGLRKRNQGHPIYRQASKNRFDQYKSSPNGQKMKGPMMDSFLKFLYEPMPVLKQISKGFQIVAKEIKSLGDMLKFVRKRPSYLVQNTIIQIIMQEARFIHVNLHIRGFTESIQNDFKCNPLFKCTCAKLK